MSTALRVFGFLMLVPTITMACIEKPKDIVFNPTSYSKVTKITPTAQGGASITFTEVNPKAETSPKDEPKMPFRKFNLNTEGQLCMESTSEGEPICKGTNEKTERIPWPTNSKGAETKGFLVVDYSKRTVYFFSTDKNGIESPRLPHLNFVFSPAPKAKKDGPMTFSDMKIESFKGNQQRGTMLINGGPKVRSLGKPKDDLDLDSSSFVPSNSETCTQGYEAVPIGDKLEESGAQTNGGQG